MPHHHLHTRPLLGYRRLARPGGHLAALYRRRTDRPRPKLFETDRANFDVLYGRIPTTKDKDKAARVADVEKYLADHKVSYASGPASVISVCIHDTLDAEGYSFVGHTGVLVDIGDGILFVEKLAFDAPYRAVTFASRSELKDYLRSMYDDGPTMDYGSPLIFENGAPLH
ncbi:DUF4300 family protein [Trueperella pecoris]|uniref:DUF4300 family protein n=1 Tax=Trueperella pecoris TaxID=2733571 RepID=A0A7M1QUB8_9ACTO|nr:DUF4300 family protein [Trueperella pecoris]QOR44965.1 DUF4300 family protein [Trueperella pecoris]